MKISIAVKLFIGFLIVIFLNVFFVVVVSKLTDLNSIAGTLKRQSEVKSAILRMSALHKNQAKSYTIFEGLRRRESVDNFRENGKDIRALLDTVRVHLEAIQRVDSIVTQEDPASQGSLKMAALCQSLTGNLVRINEHYARGFENFAALAAQPTNIRTSANEAALKRLIEEASDSVSMELRRAEVMLDEQSRFRLKDIDLRVDNVKKLTLIILASMTIFSLVFAFFFSRATTTSLRRLKMAASQIAKGNFDFDPRGYPNDEIGDLSSALFDMAYDLKNAQEELVKSKRLAAIGEVVASVNHEINNPLMIISGNAQFLEMSMEGYPREILDRVKAIIDETERISKVTKKLREIRNPVVEDYTSSGEQMINLDKSSG